MSINLKELIATEKQLKDKKFTQEESNLNDLNRDFSDINGIDFINWLKILNSSKGKDILEIGGGRKQVVAIQILTQFPELNLFEIELKPIEEDTLYQLSQTGHYYLFNKGFSQIITNLKSSEKKFSLIFAHNLLQHLPDPFYIIEECYRLLEKNGLLFFNGLLIYEEEWEKINNFLREKGYQFSFKKIDVPSYLKKKGIISISLTMIKKDQELSIPLIRGKELTDFYGNKIGSYEIFFENN